MAKGSKVKSMVAWAIVGDDHSIALPHIRYKKSKAVEDLERWGCSKPYPFDIVRVKIIPDPPKPKKPKPPSSFLERVVKKGRK